MDYVDYGRDPGGASYRGGESDRTGDASRDRGDPAGLGPARPDAGALTAALGAGACYEDSNAMGVSGNQADNSAFDAGAVYLY